MESLHSTAELRRNNLNWSSRFCSWEFSISCFSVHCPTLQGDLQAFLPKQLISNSSPLHNTKFCGCYRTVIQTTEHVCNSVAWFSINIRYFDHWSATEGCIMPHYMLFSIASDDLPLLLVSHLGYHIYILLVYESFKISPQDGTLFRHNILKGLLFKCFQIGPVEYFHPVQHRQVWVMVPLKTLQP